MKWFFDVYCINLLLLSCVYIFPPYFHLIFFLRCFISFFFLSFDYFLDELYRLFPHEFQNAQLMAKEDVDMHKWTDSRRWNRRSPLCQFFIPLRTPLYFFRKSFKFLLCMYSLLLIICDSKAKNELEKKKKTIFFRIEKSLKWRPGPAFHIEMILVNAHKINFKYLHSYYSFSDHSSFEQITNFLDWNEFLQMKVFAFGVSTWLSSWKKYLKE